MEMQSAMAATQWLQWHSSKSSYRAWGGALTAALELLSTPAADPLSILSQLLNFSSYSML